MKIEKMADVFLNSAKLTKSTFLTLALPKNIDQDVKS
jgi:hypothetical protein